MLKYKLRMLRHKLHYRWLWITCKGFREGIKQDRWVRKYFQEHGHLPHAMLDPWYKALH